MSGWLEAMHAQVRRQYEVVPFLGGTYPVDELEFRPLPADMLAIVRTSPDYEEPAAGVPVMLMLETEEQSGGLMMLKEPVSGSMFVLAPKA